MTALPQRRSRLFWLVLIYGLLLLGSGLVRWGARPPAPRADQVTQLLPRIEGAVPTGGQPVRLAFVDSGGEGAPVLLLHGSPAASYSMMALHHALVGRGYRVLTPDLPGFGKSEARIPDYSIRAHGRYLLAWMDSLGLATAHVVGYSMSGGVLLEAHRQQPGRFRSATMLSAIGVQELELTGQYHLNHTIHGLQLAGLWALRELTPHFGYLDDAILGVPYAQNFYQTDQRPLRRILEAFELPMRIIHAEDDPLVPFPAAQEHHRIVPQSELIALESGGHGLPFVRPDTTAALIASFLARVDAGGAPSRADAAGARLQAAAIPFDHASLPPPGGFVVAILMLLVAAATMASEDLASIGSGLMAAQGTLTFPQAVLAALAGIVLGDMLLYLAGRWLGHPLVRRAPFRWFVTEQQLSRGEQWFEERGIRAVLVARFVPGTRLPTYVAAGVLKAPFFKFFGYFLVAALLWTPAIVGTAMFLGRRVLRYYSVFEQYAVWVLLAMVVLLFVGFRVAPHLASHVGRQRLRGRWLRLTTWEFWPPWLFYPPVLVWCAWLGLRYRHPLAFTASNPGIPHSGLVGESKAAILAALPGDWVAPFRVIEHGDDPSAATQAALAFANDQWPIVLKPDIGERGRGVRIARSAEEVRAYFDQIPGRSIAQRYVPGVEFGVFYYRDPRSREGRILSITDKRFPSVTGDGKRSMHRLILDDARAVAMLPAYENANRKRLDMVPAPGQSVQLVELGTHCRGAVFLDGQALATDALTRVIDQIATEFPGFHFGRFDLRAPSATALSSGTEFKIIELNGVTSEATHIYAPGTPILSAYRTLFRQWELAFAIGAANRAAGARVSTPREVLALLGHHFRSRRA